MKSPRRRFLKQSLSLAFTSTFASPTFGRHSFADASFKVDEGQSSVFEQQQSDAKRSAQHIMVFASPYDTNNWQYSPHMHRELKQNVESLSQGRIFVDIKDKGQLGVGTQLMAQVSRGHISAALVSASNLSRAAPELDILNIPFWAAENQQYLNLITSETWQKLIIDKISKQGLIDVMFPYVVGARTATSTLVFNRRFAQPSDLDGVMFRIPASGVLAQFYQLLNTRPVPVEWGKVARFARANLIQGLDPAITGLYNGPNGLRTQIGVISEIESVHDGWMAVVSQAWRDTLPGDLQEVLSEAAQLTFKEHLTMVSECAANCRKEFTSRGVEIYRPNQNERELWRDVAGYHRREWNGVKREVLGGVEVFEELLQAAGSNQGFTLSNRRNV